MPDVDDSSSYPSVPVADDDDDPDHQVGELDFSGGELSADAAALIEADDYSTLVQSLKGTATNGTILPPLGKSPSKKGLNNAAHHRTTGSTHDHPSASSASSVAFPAPSSSPSPSSTPSTEWILRKLKVWKLLKTHDMFQAEWADLQEKGGAPTKEQIGAVPHENLVNNAEKNEVKIGELERELNKTGNIAK